MSISSLDTKSSIVGFIIYCILLSVMLIGCTEDKKALVITYLNSHSEFGGEPNLHMSANGQLLHSWLEYQEDTVSLVFSKLEDEHWTDPLEIAQGDNWFVNWADFPSISSYRENPNHLVAHWLQKSGIGTFDYDVQISHSTDGGMTWDSSFVIHDDGIAAEHGFVSMFPIDSDRMLVTWLDGRNTKISGLTKDDHGHGHHGSMTLRAAEIDVYGNKYYDKELDAKICDCCQTGAAVTSCGPVVVYRDRSDEEIRDIYIVRRDQNEWTEPTAVYHDRWKITGCPVNGPAVVAHGSRVAVAWFAMADDSPEVKLAFSDDCGDNFRLPIRIDSGDPLGRVDLIMKNQDEVIISWLEATEEGADIMMATVHHEKGMTNSWSVINTKNTRGSGFPRIEKYGDDVILAWTAASDSTTFVQSAIIHL